MLTLLLVGGTALVSALTSGPAQVSQSPTPVSSPSPSRPATPAPAPSPGGEPVGNDLPLRIRVLATTTVLVKVADSGEILYSGVLAPGDVRQYSQTPLDVVAANGAALQVTIYGKVQAAKPANQRGGWFVPEQ
ncbi:RodZ domain-containing protein [Actinomadura craniellae]|uniref:RodZ domain-containing protein n=1 Tax=Actinomadura craniellae TaxID=2231787 RepID=UPI001F1825FD|nr:RodZ domain-containing protein [Actinomadura craniellae]